MAQEQGILSAKQGQKAPQQRGFPQVRRDVHQRPDWLAGAAVPIGPVSASFSLLTGNFTGSLLTGNFTGNFQNSRQRARRRCLSNIDLPGISEQIPYATEQGIISVEQGILVREQGISPTKTEIIAG